MCRGVELDTGRQGHEDMADGARALAPDGIRHPHTHSTNIHEKKGWLKLKARRRRVHKTVPVSHYIELSDCVENNTLGERRGAGGHGCLAYHNGRRHKPRERTFILSQSFKAFLDACVCMERDAALSFETATAVGPKRSRGT